MKNLLWHLKLIGLFLSQDIKTKMEYNLDFITGMLGGFIINLSRIATTWLLFQNIPRLNGWEFNEILFFLGFFQAAILLHDFIGIKFWSLSYDIRSGNFIKYYFRPLNMMVYYLSDAFNIRGTLINGSIAAFLLIYSGIQLNIDWTFGKVLLLAVNLFSASLIPLCILGGGMIASFWIVNSGALTMTLSALRDHSHYPLTIYSKGLQKLFTFIIPIGFICFYPCQPFLRPISEVPVTAWFSPVVGPLLFFLVYRLWKAGIRQYNGTGS